MDNETASGRSFRTRHDEANDGNASAIRALLQEISGKVDRLDQRIDGQIERINKRIDPLEQRMLRDDDRDGRFMDAIKVFSDTQRQLTETQRHLAVHEAQSGHAGSIARLAALEADISYLKQRDAAMRAIERRTSWFVGIALTALGLLAMVTFNVIKLA